MRPNTRLDAVFVKPNAEIVANSGGLTLVAELRDSVTSEVLARAVDTQNGRGVGTMTWTSRVTNIADARSAIRVWAAALRRALDEMVERAAAKTAAAGVGVAPLWNVRLERARKHPPADAGALAM